MGTRGGGTGLERLGLAVDTSKQFFALTHRLAQSLASGHAKNPVGRKDPDSSGAWTWRTSRWQHATKLFPDPPGPGGLELCPVGATEVRCVLRPTALGHKVAASAPARLQPWKVWAPTRAQLGRHIANEAIVELFTSARSHGWHGARTTTV